MSLFGAPNIQKLIAKKNLKKLIKALGYKKDYSSLSTRKDIKQVVTIHSQAAKTLGEIGDPSAVVPLIAALNDKSKYVRREASTALGEIGDPRAVTALITALKDSDKYVRGAAAYALGKIQDPRAITPLIRRLHDGNDYVRYSAVWALSEIQDPLAVEPLIDFLRRYGDIKEDHLDTLKEAEEALKKLGEFSKKSLIKIMMDEKNHLRKSAARILERLNWVPDKNANGAAYWIAKGKWDRCIRIGAPAVEPLIEALKTFDYSLKREVANALDGLGWAPDQSVDGAFYWIAKGNWDRCIQIGKPAIEPIIDAFLNGSEDIRKSAEEALLRIGKPAFRPFLESVRFERIKFRPDVALLMGKFDDLDAIGPLIKALKKGTKSVRAAAAEALGNFSGTPVTLALKNALNDKDHDVRIAAAKALEP